MKEALIKTASELIVPDTEAVQAFITQRDALCRECSARLEKREDLDKLIGAGNLDMARDNNRNFARFMESTFSDFEPQLLVHTVLWVFEAYRSHGFKTTYWSANLNIWVDELKRLMPEEAFTQIYPFYHWIIVHIPVFTQLTDETLSDTDYKDSIKNAHN